MDNASNCDVLADELASLIPGFRGKTSRTCCVPHTINLIAKVRCNNVNDFECLGI